MPGPPPPPTPTPHLLPCRTVGSFPLHASQVIVISEERVILIFQNINDLPKITSQHESHRAETDLSSGHTNVATCPASSHTAHPCPQT
jgi:hypothetical protein